MAQSRRARRPGAVRLAAHSQERAAQPAGEERLEQPAPTGDTGRLSTSTIESARRIGESLVITVVSSASLYLVGSVYTDAYYGRLSIEVTSLDLAPAYVGLQSIHAAWALLEYPLIIVLLYVLYRVVACFVPRSARWVNETRERSPRVLAVLANILIVLPLLIDGFQAGFWNQELPHQSVLTEVTSLLRTAGLLLVGYAVWLAWHRRFLLAEIRAHRTVPVALVFTVYLLAALASTAVIAELAAEDLLTGASDAALRVEFLRQPGVLPELDGKELILVTARDSVYYVVEREPVPPSERPTSFAIPYSAVEAAEVSRFE